MQINILHSVGDMGSTIYLPYYAHVQGPLGHRRLIRGTTLANARIRDKVVLKVLQKMKRCKKCYTDTSRQTS